jgi:sugar phosphate isomerase/epimerase
MKTFKFIMLLSVAFLTVLCTNKTEPVKKGKNIGLQSYSLRGPISNDAIGLDSVITAIGEMGYKYIETASYYDGTIYGLSPEEFKAKLDAAGIYALSCHVRQDMGEDMDLVWAWWDKCIATHKAAGMSYIVVPSMPGNLSIEDLQTYCEYYNKIGEKCDAAGLKFGYHNHAYEFEKIYDIDGKKVAMYDYMVEHTNPANVFFEMDVYWLIKGGRTPVELFNKYPGRYLVLHIKDEAELGESGMVGFDGIFKHIATAGTKYLIVEVERYSIPEIESVKVSLDYLNNSAFVKDDYSK